MKSNDYEDFLQLLSKHQLQIWRFVRTLLPHEGDADDVFQETSLALWSRWNDYDKDRSFASWAFGVARLQTLRFLRQQKSDRLVLNEAVIEVVADAAYEQLVADESLAGRRDALKTCLDSLDQSSRAMIDDRYARSLSAKAIAEEREAPLPTIYSALARVRQRLHECIQRKLAATEH